MKACRNPILLVALLGILCAEAGTQSPSLLPERNGDQIRVSAPQLHFLSGKAVEKLQTGSTVTYLMTLTVQAGNSRKTVAQSREKFIISFDLWEEKYSAVQDGPGGRSASRMTAAAAEAWCVENVAIPVHSIPERQSFMLRFECVEGDDGSGKSEENHSTLTLAGLIDVFSRKKREEPFRWQAVAGPFRLEDLRK